MSPCAKESNPATDQAAPSSSAEQEEAYLQQYFSEAEAANRASLLRMLNQQCPDITTHEHLRMLAPKG